MEDTVETLSPAPPRRIVCDRVLGNIADGGTLERLAGKARDSVAVDWPDLSRRAFRKTSSLGCGVGVLLPLGTSLRHGDILYEDAGRYIVADQAPSDLWLARPATPAALALVALELGNLHVPVEVSPDGEIYTLPDGPTAGVFRRHGVPHLSCHRRFTPVRATVTSGVRMSQDFQVVTR